MDLSHADPPLDPQYTVPVHLPVASPGDLRLIGGSSKKGTSMLTWKRRARKGQATQVQTVEHEDKKKKRGSKGERVDELNGERGRTLGKEEGLWLRGELIGSGMTEAAAADRNDNNKLELPRA